MVEAAVLRRLAATLDGRVLTPDAPDYDTQRATFNGMLGRRPALIVECASTDDVVAAVRAARELGLTIAVRGGGHGVAGHAVADGALVVDLRRLRGVSVDPTTARADAQGGAQWDDVDAAAFVHGLAMPGGTFGDTGVAGLTLTGGIGWLIGTGGFTCDVLMAADVVAADGSIVRASLDGEGDGEGDADLLWALRGGGGNFGVVTRFTFALAPVGPLMGGYLRIGGRRGMADTLRAMAEVQASAPRELEMMTDTAHAEDGSPLTHLGLVYQGDAGSFEQLIAPFRLLGPVVADDLGPMGYLEAQAMNGRLPFGLRHYWKGHFLRELDATAQDAIVEAIDRARGRSGVLIEAIHGRAAEEPDGGAAFGQRGARWNLSALGIWEDPDDDAASIAWARAAADAFRPSSLTGGGYGNYAPDDEPEERIVAMYGRERWERLQAVKRRYDPDNVFRHNHNIPPAPDQ